MKNNISKSAITFFSLMFFIVGSYTSSFAQTTAVKSAQKTISFHVSGVCGDCKERIESTALDVKGVKKAEWDAQTDMLVLVGSEKMDKQKVANALAKAGHGSELAAADPNGYAKLPACCQYDNGAKKH